MFKFVGHGEEQPGDTRRYRPLAWLESDAAQRRAAGLRRSLRPRAAVATDLDLASNDYLGLSQHPEVIEAGVSALRTWGAGSTGSRLVTGDTDLHEQFERELAEFVGAAAALVFSSGYTANIGAVVALSGPGSLLVSDAYSHASLVDACRLSRARVVVTPHRDVDAVDAALAARAEERAVVVTDSVFSADGALAPLRAAARRVPAPRRGAAGRRGPRSRCARRRRAGPARRGRPGRCARHRDDHDAVQGAGQSGRSGAGLGGGARPPDRCGARRSSSTPVWHRRPSGSAAAALRLLIAEPGRADAVLAHARALADMCGVTEKPESAVVSVILGDPEVALAAADACLQHGVRVGCFRPPTVPVGTSRLRLTVRASLTAEDLARARRVLTEVLSAARP